MKLKKFVLLLVLAVFLLFFHYFVLFIPASELFLIYLLFFKPKWFREYLND